MRKSISKGEWELRFTTGDFREDEWLATLELFHCGVKVTETAMSVDSRYKPEMLLRILLHRMRLTIDEIFIYADDEYCWEDW